MPVDSYQAGDVLTSEDFVDSYYMPEGRYTHCEVVSVGDGDVELSFVNEEDGIDDRMTVSRDQMARMLGWEDDVQLGADDIQTEVLEKQVELMLGEGEVAVDSPDGSVGEVEDDEVESILSAPPEEAADGGELVDTDGVSDKHAWVETVDGFATRLHLYATREACLEGYHAHTR